VLSHNEQKIVLKEHDHSVECVAWAPDCAFNYVCEAAGSDVSFCSNAFNALKLMDSLLLFVCFASSEQAQQS
jgi:hypothetical protein